MRGRVMAYTNDGRETNDTFEWVYDGTGPAGAITPKDVVNSTVTLLLQFDEPCYGERPKTRRFLFPWLALRASCEICVETLVNE